MTRFYLTRVVKIVFAVSTVSFVLIQLQMSKQTNGETSASTKVDQTVPKENKRQQLQLAVGDTIGGELPPLMPQPPVKLSNSSTASDPLTKILGSSSSAGLPSANEIRQLIEENNANADVLNERKFGPGNTSSLVILIQVHNRPKYLEKLVESLRAARDISSVLLIFSHDFYSAELNKIIRQIDFCRVSFFTLPT